MFYCGIAIYYDKYTFLQSFKKWSRFRANLIFRNLHHLIKDTTLYKGLNRFSKSHLVGASFSIIIIITSKFWIVTHLALMRKLKQNHQKILFSNFHLNLSSSVNHICGHSVQLWWCIKGTQIVYFLCFFFQFQQIHTVEDVKISTMFLTRLSSYSQVGNSTRITTRNITRAELQSRQRRLKLNL